MEDAIGHIKVQQYLNNLCLISNKSMLNKKEIKTKLLLGCPCNDINKKKLECHGAAVTWSVVHVGPEWVVA